MRTFIWTKKEFFKDELPVCAFQYWKDSDVPYTFTKREFFKISLFGPGKITVLHDGTEWNFNGKLLALTHPDELTIIDFPQGTHVINVLILSDFIREIAKNLHDPNGFFRILEENAQEDAFFPHVLEITPHLNRLLNDILFELQHTDSNTVSMLQSQLTGLLIEFSRAYYAAQTRISSLNRMSKIKEYLQVHFREKITTAFLAKKFNLSLPYLFARWKKENRKTIGEFLTDIRLQNAVSLLKKRGNSSLKIAKESGFPNAGSYYMSFQRYYGCTPAQYLKQNCNKKS